MESEIHEYSPRPYVLDYNPTLHDLSLKIEDGTSVLQITEMDESPFIATINLNDFLSFTAIQDKEGVRQNEFALSILKTLDPLVKNAPETKLRVTVRNYRQLQNLIYQLLLSDAQRAEPYKTEPLKHDDRLVFPEIIGQFLSEFRSKSKSVPILGSLAAKLQSRDLSEEERQDREESRRYQLRHFIESKIAEMDEKATTDLIDSMVLERAGLLASLEATRKRTRQGEEVRLPIESDVDEDIYLEETTGGERFFVQRYAVSGIDNVVIRSISGPVNLTGYGSMNFISTPPYKVEVRVPVSTENLLKQLSQVRRSGIPVNFSLEGGTLTIEGSGDGQINLTVALPLFADLSDARKNHRVVLDGIHDGNLVVEGITDESFIVEAEEITGDLIKKKVKCPVRVGKVSGKGVSREK